MASTDYAYTNLQSADGFGQERDARLAALGAELRAEAERAAAEAEAAEAPRRAARRR